MGRSPVLVCGHPPLPDPSPSPRRPGIRGRLWICLFWTFRTHWSHITCGRGARLLSLGRCVKGQPCAGVPWRGRATPRPRTRTALVTLPGRWHGLGGRAVASLGLLRHRETPRPARRFTPPPAVVGPRVSTRSVLALRVGGGWQLAGVRCPRWLMVLSAFCGADWLLVSLLRRNIY